MLNFVMSLLVRNVYELVNPLDFEIGKEVAIKLGSGHTKESMIMANNIKLE